MSIRISVHGNVRDELASACGNCVGKIPPNSFSGPPPNCPYCHERFLGATMVLQALERLIATGIAPPTALITDLLWRLGSKP